MNTAHDCRRCCMNRRQCLQFLSASALGAGLLSQPRGAAGQEKPQPDPTDSVDVAKLLPKPEVRMAATFLEMPRPYWLGWPGTTYDLDRHQKEYRTELEQSAQRVGIKLALEAKPISAETDVATWITKVKAEKPHGLLVMLQHMGCWGWANRVAKEAGIPLIVFSPVGTSFTGHVAGASRQTLPKTYMVASSDLNPGVHPHDKDRYGGRAADVALNTVYGKPIQSFGPRYQSHQVAGNKLRLTFSQTGKGLVAAHTDNPQGFALAGADRKFVWAEARIIAPNAVELWSDQVKEPIAARYAYGCRIPWANLFNQEGLPAATFRTDTWTWEGQNPIFVWQMFFTESRRMNWVWTPAE